MKVVAPDARCCSNGCLKAWKVELGQSLAEAVIRTELGAFGAMREAGRQQHFMMKLKECSIPVIETASDGSGNYITGKL